MAEVFKTLKVEQEEPGLLVVTLNRPEVRNAINTEMGLELRNLFKPLVFGARDLRCILITGVGGKAFCAGGDLKERQGMTDTAWRAQHSIFEEAFYAIMECSIPVIASVNGVAFGGGCELALACDFVYAAEHAKFALTETTLGIIPGVGGTQNLPRAVGERRAKEIIMTGRPFTAQEGRAWGLVNQVVNSDSLMRVTLNVASQIIRNAPIAVRQAKKAIHHGLDVDLRTGLAFELEAYNRTVVTKDRIEGMRAFADKRPPDFVGE
jgi:enoyl-CoA hydratase